MRPDTPQKLAHPQDWQTFMEATRAFSHDPSDDNARRLAAATGRLSRLRSNGDRKLRESEREESAKARVA